MYISTREGLGQPGRGPRLNGLGECVVPASVAVRKLHCTAADLAAISGVVGKAVTADDVRRAITTAVEQAVRLLLDAAQPLTRPRPKATSEAGDKLWRHFKEAFGVAPDFHPTWRPAGARWDRGDVVRERLRCAARILANGSIRYRCWGPLSCRDFPTAWIPEHFARVFAGELRICFGEAFWRAFGDPSRAAELASTLAHEALHIYFHTIGDTRERGPFGFAACYERFVLLMNRLPLSQYVKEMCRSGIPRGDFPLPKPGGPRIA